MARVRRHWKKLVLIVLLLAAVTIGYWAGYRSTVAYKIIELPVAKGIVWTEVIPISVESFAYWECARAPDERAVVALFTYSVPYDRRFVVTKFNQDGTVSSWLETPQAHQASNYAQLTASEVISVTSIVASLPKFRSGPGMTESGAYAKMLTWAVYSSEQGCILQLCWDNECSPEIEALRNLKTQAFERDCQGSCVKQVK